MTDSTTTQNPLSRNNSRGSLSNGTIYDKIAQLSDEIIEGIYNLSPGEERSLLINEVHMLKQEAMREKSPEVAQNLLLFRKYAEIANQIKDSSKYSNSFINDLPALVSEYKEEELIGWKVR